MLWLFAIISTALISISISIDAFLVSFAYGCKKIKIPMLSAFIITTICSIVIGISFLFGSVLVFYIPERLTAALAFTILFFIGITKLFDSITKSIIEKYTQFNKEINISVFNLKLLMRLYVDPESADADSSNSISSKEAVLLAVSLSLDGLAVGLGAAMIGVNWGILILFTLVSGFVALVFGEWVGRKAVQKMSFNVSWLAGVILIGLAFVQLV